MPISPDPTNATATYFTPQMAQLLDTSLPNTTTAIRTRFLNAVFQSIENRTSLPGNYLATAEYWGQQGTFGKVYQALKPHAVALGTSEQRRLWQLCGLQDIYASGAPRFFNQVINKLYQWEERNPVSMTEQLGLLHKGATHPAWHPGHEKHPYHDLYANLYREFGLSNNIAAAINDKASSTPGLRASELRENLVGAVVNECESIRLTEVTHFGLMRRKEDNTLGVAVWNIAEPKKRVIVPLVAMLEPLRALG